MKEWSEIITNARIANALLLIAGLLTFIAWKVSSPRPHRPAKKSAV